MDHRFDAVTNYFAAHKGGAHAFVAHGNAVANGNRAKFKGNTTGISNAGLGTHC